MTNSRLAFMQQYSTSLLAYLSSPTEALREQAYQMGVEAVTQELGVLDVAAAHQESLASIMSHPQAADEGEQTARRASEFLMDSLAPFEMTHRGYRETIGNLIAANEERARLAGEHAARVEAEAAGARIAAILESITDSFFALDREWRFTYVNRQAEQLLRRSREGLIGKSIWEELPQAAGTGLEEGIRRAASAQTTVHLAEFYAPLKAWLQVNVYPSEEGLSVYFRDVTEEQRRQRARLGLARVAHEIASATDADQALAITAVELVASFDIALARVWLWDEASHALELRASAGLSARTAATGSRYATFSSGQSKIGAIAASRQPLSTNELQRQPWLADPEWARREGIVAFAGFPLLTGDQLLGVMGLFSHRALEEDDLTALGTLADQLAVAIDKTRLLERIQSALRLRQEFIAAAAHELRTPLTTLKGYTVLLNRSLDTMSPATDRALKQMDSSVDRIVRLASQLVDADALDRGTLRLNPQRTDLAEVAQQVVGQVQEANPNYSIRLKARRVMVLVDRERLNQIFRYLLDNAIKYQPGGGEVAVEIDIEGGQAVVAVRDYGAGIPPERWTNVFEPMYEPLPSGAVGYVGVVGLGLAISKRLIELHGGRIWFESQVGKGSTFHFSLPVVESNGSREQ